MNTLKIRLSALLSFLFLFLTSSAVCAVATCINEELTVPAVLIWTVVNGIWLYRTLKILKDPSTVEKEKEEINIIL